MKFICQKSDLSGAIQNASKALSARPSIAILECIHIIAENNTLKLTCSDGALYIRSEVPAQVEVPGSAIIDARLFSDIIRHFPSNAVNVSMDANKLITVTGSGNRSTIAGQSDSNYPVLNRPIQDEGIHLPQNILKSMISHVLFAIAIGEVRETLNGGFLEITRSELRLVGLDGFKLSIQKFQDHIVLPDGKESLSCIIPSKALAEVSHMCSDDEQMLTIHMNASNVLFVINNNIITSTLYAGTYLNYQSLLPKSWETRIVVKKDSLLGAVERAGLIAKTLNNNIVKLKIEDSQVHVNSKSEVGDVHEVMDAEVDGKPLEIAFNGKYLSEVLKNVDVERCEIHMNGPLAPCVVTPYNNPNQTYLLMSVRV